MPYWFKLKSRWTLLDGIAVLFGLSVDPLDLFPASDQPLV
jgi:hypothetical protein